MITLPTRNPEKQAASDKAAEDVKRFLEQGGKIYHAAIGESGMKDRAHTFTINNEKCNT